jgi:hypothetical protein
MFGKGAHFWSTLSHWYYSDVVYVANKSGVGINKYWSLSLVFLLSVEHLLPGYWRRGMFVLCTENKLKGYYGDMC